MVRWLGDQGLDAGAFRTEYDDEREDVAVGEAVPAHPGVEPDQEIEPPP